MRRNVTLYDRIDVLPGFDLTHTLNRGIAFSLFQGSARVVAVLTIFVLIAIAAAVLRSGPVSRLSAIAVGGLVGGAIGNFIDRIRMDGVTDFISIGAWPSFNIADIGITCGAGLIVLTMLFAPQPEEEPDPSGDE